MAGFHSDINWDEIAAGGAGPSAPAGPSAASESSPTRGAAYPSRREIRERATSASRMKSILAPRSPKLAHAKPSVTPANPALARQASASQKPREHKPREHKPREHKRGSGATKRGLLPRLVTLSAMLGAGALLVSTSLPAIAFEPSSADAVRAPISSAQVPGVQKLSVESTVLVAASIRDSYTVEDTAIAAKMLTANKGYLFTNNPNGTIQWPFAQPVPVSSGFGSRQVANCSYCSTYHEGLDFVPGFGVPIQAVADGVVSEIGVTGSYGNHVIIDHVINGKKVQTLYGHMSAGSMTLTMGQTVTVAQIVGKVGSTGNSTGPHLHLEVRLDGTPVDPFIWLKANAN